MQRCSVYYFNPKNGEEKEEMWSKRRAGLKGILPHKSNREKTSKGARRCIAS